MFASGGRFVLLLAASTRCSQTSPCFITAPFFPPYFWTISKIFLVSFSATLANFIVGGYPHWLNIAPNRLFSNEHTFLKSSFLNAFWRDSFLPRVCCTFCADFSGIYLIVNSLPASLKLEHCSHTRFFLSRLRVGFMGKGGRKRYREVRRHWLFAMLSCISANFS